MANNRHNEQHAPLAEELCRSAVCPEKESNFKMARMALFALLTVIGTHKPASTHAPTCTRARN
jgi:hypothetical protein